MWAAQALLGMWSQLHKYEMEAITAKEILSTQARPHLYGSTQGNYGSMEATQLHLTAHQRTTQHECSLNILAGEVPSH